MIAAICDDDFIFRKALHDLLVEYKKSRRVQLDIVEFSNGEELLKYEYPCDIVFMDYEMPIMDGMEVARQLRARKSLCCIIFITNFPQYVFDSFEVNTYRYFVKSHGLEKLNDALDKYIKIKKMMAPITLNIDGEQLTINSEDIVYLEADGKYCNIRTTSDFLHCSKTLSQVLNLLPQHCFYRTHKSYAVNFYCISSIKIDEAVLTNKERIKISRKNKTKFKESYKEFLKYFISEN